MNINEVKFDELSGYPIIEGKISIGEGKAAEIINVAEHNDLLFVAAFDSKTIKIQPATEIKQSASGFYSCSADMPALLLPLKISDIRSLCDIDGKKRSFIRSGFGSGEITRNAVPNSVNNNYGEYSHDFKQFIIEAGYVEKGIFLKISGYFLDISNYENNPDPSATASTTNASAEMLISWEHMVLLGFSSCPNWKFEPIRSSSSGVKLPDRIRNPRKLQDILISEGSCHPVLEGSLNVLPVKRRSRLIPTEIKFIEISNIGDNFLRPYDDCLHFGDASYSGLNDSGFVHTQGANYWISIDVVGRNQFEQVFRTNDKLSMSLQGDGLGSIRYYTRYGHYHSDPFKFIQQTIKSLVLNAVLNERGLVITIDAKLNDFDSELIAEHRRERDSKLLPYKNFNMHVILPWSLLLVRRFSFANKVEKFW